MKKTDETLLSHLLARNKMIFILSLSPGDDQVIRPPGLNLPAGS
jgi:hypothetical protein